MFLKMSSPENKKPRILQPGLRPDLIEEETVNEIQSAWRVSGGDGFTKNDVKIIRDPFPVCVIRNFVNDPELLTLAAGELKDVKFHEKSNDLYEFKQSDDVRNLTNFTFIPQLYELIRVEGRTWVGNVVRGNKLTKDISATFSSYGFQDRLLCHDDKCEDRHIAFILYLVDDWNEDDGGCLELFNTDSNGYPDKIVRSITPEFNMMIFFEVTHSSFHQVSEVKSKTKNRLSLNGWFHSSGKKLGEPQCVILENPKTLPNDSNYNLEEYFSKTYFNDTNKIDVKDIFTSQSEIQLDGFIEPKFLEEIEMDLRSEAVTWTRKGPPNIRNYEVAETSTLPASLLKLKEIFESVSWFKFLTEITALDFAPLSTTDLKKWEMGTPAVCSFEIQKWTHACYTLIHDKDPEQHRETLDVILRIPFQNTEYVNSEEDSPQSGHIIYIDSTSRDEECLLHIGYKMNSLGLIFRDEQTLRFTKYLDSTAKPFYLILCTYNQWKSNVAEDDSEGSVSDSSSSDDS